MKTEQEHKPSILMTEDVFKKIQDYPYYADLKKVVLVGDIAWAEGYYSGISTVLLLNRKQRRELRKDKADREKLIESLKSNRHSILKTIKDEKKNSA